MPPRSPRKRLEPQFGDRIRLGVLTEEITPEVVDEVLELTGRAERRRRLLPARAVVYFLCQDAYVRGVKVLGILHDLRESLETVAGQIACVISGTSQRVPYLTVQSGKPATESLDCCLSRSQALRLWYDGSFWDALQREERIGGRNPPLHRGCSMHRIPRAHPCPRIPRHSLRHKVTRPAQSAHVNPRPVAVWPEPKEQP
ncbi:transposase domain-containing protein [Streptomyces nodosus]|uniref:transposase domain-containing protein n=1 Tax=Streptomyces nodosus TaxID=40318 RepID=UPI001D119FD2|nr:transposase domain-containing protein [Streptomyces nodosus]